MSRVVRNRLLFAMAVMLLNGSFARSQSQREFEDLFRLKGAFPWKASWITSPDAPRKEECVLRFRKQITLDSAPSHYIVHVSADNQFLLEVNGKLVGSGPSHSDLLHWKYETYDLAPALHAGSNQIAATVWNLGDDAPVRQVTDRIGFLIDGDTAREEGIRSDKTWQVAIDKGIVTLPTPAAMRKQYYVGSPAESIDGHSLRWDWNKPAISNQARAIWKEASVIGLASAKGMAFAATNWQLMADELPPMETTEQDTGKVVRISGLQSAGTFPKGKIEIAAHQKATLLIDVGHLTTGFPELTLSKGDHAKVVLTYAEALYDSNDKKQNRNEVEGKHILGIFDEVHPNGETSQNYMPLDWRTWRYLQLDVETDDQPIELDSLRTWFTAYPFQEAGSFNSDDPTLKAIWEIGWRTARLCAHDTYMDTPYWERLQYTGDTRVQALISYTVGGDDRLARQAIEAFRNSTIPEGITLSHYPASAFQNIPGFSLYWVGMVHDFWMYRNDSDFVRSQLPVVRSTLDWFRSKQNGNGLMGRLPWWPFVDWSAGFLVGVPPQTATGDSAILSLQYVEALQYAAAMEDSVGNKALAIQDTGEAKRVALAVRELCWDRRRGLVADTPDKTHFSQHANAFAVWLDVVPAEDQQAVMQKVMSASDPSFTSATPQQDLSVASYYYRFYLARALVHAGLGDRYMETLTPWKTMISNGLTTWAETPEPSRSDSHAWSAHPNYDLLTIVAGIAPAKPNFASVNIEPHLGTLHHVAAAVPSPSGLITAIFDKKETELSATITLPAGMTGSLRWNGIDYTLSAGVKAFRLPLTVASLKNFKGEAYTTTGLEPVEDRGRQGR